MGSKDSSTRSTGGPSELALNMTSSEYVCRPGQGPPHSSAIYYKLLRPHSKSKQDSLEASHGHPEWGTG